MAHIVIFSRSCLDLLSEENETKDELLRELLSLSQKQDFVLYFTSHDDQRRPNLGQQPVIVMNFVQRGDPLRDFIKESWKNGKVVIIVGAVNKDLEVAASTKSFLIGAGWVQREGKVEKYGVKAPTPRSMTAILDIIANQSGWYYKCAFDEPVPTVVLALCNANTYSSGIDPDEKDVAEKFQAVLKDDANNPVIRKAMMCHLMTAIAHDTDFREVQDWAIAPSSSTGPNQVMEVLKEHVRYMMNGRKPEPIFVRHTKVGKSRFDGREMRQQPNYCEKHFASIVVSEKYRGQLTDRVVCVLDDYLNHGNTFEALRNLLVACGVKKIIFLAIGKFMSRDENGYETKMFDIDGDVHRKYSAKFDKKTLHRVFVSENAKRSMGNLNVLSEFLEG